MHWCKFYVSSLVDLQASSNQMNLFPSGTIAKRPVPGGGRRLSWREEQNLNLPAQLQPPNPSKYVITQKGKVTGLRRVDTSQSLNGAIITIQAPQQPVNTLQPYVDAGIQNYQSKPKAFLSRRSKQSEAALAALDSMKNAGVGLTELLHAVLWYTKPEVTDPRNKQLEVPVGEKLPSNSTLRTSLLQAYEQWRASA